MLRGCCCSRCCIRCPFNFPLLLPSMWQELETKSRVRGVKKEGKESFDHVNKWSTRHYLPPFSKWTLHVSLLLFPTNEWFATTLNFVSTSTFATSSLLPVRSSTGGVNSDIFSLAPFRKDRKRCLIAEKEGKRYWCCHMLVSCCCCCYCVLIRCHRRKHRDSTSGLLKTWSLHIDEIYIELLLRGILLDLPRLCISRALATWLAYANRIST